MSPAFPRFICRFSLLLCVLTFARTLLAQTPAGASASEAVVYDADTRALVLARSYLQGGDASRAALQDALKAMGWGVRDASGKSIVTAPQAGDTGLALRDYEVEELLWKPSEQPAIRLISFAQAIALPFETSDPEELAQDLLEAVRTSANSTQPQQRFWGRFIIALGVVSPTGYDLAQPGAAASLPLSKAEQKSIQEAAAKNPFAAINALKQRPVYPEDDPVLAPSPRVAPAEGIHNQSSTERDTERMQEINSEYIVLARAAGDANPEVRKQAQEKMASLGQEIAAISQRQQAAMMRQMSESMGRLQNGDAGGTEDDEDDASSGPRFLAEHREQPLSLLQVALITKVLAADLRLAATTGKTKLVSHSVFHTSSHLPLATLLAQVPAPSFGDQFVGAIGDIWATATGAYTGAVLDHHLPDSKFSKGMGVANVIIAWFKTIMSVARQNITIEVENAPLLRTKTRSPGEQRTARAKVAIDFPKHDALKAIRAAANLATLDLQLPDGGPVSGAKVVWRLPEGSYNTKYQTSQGGSTYRPELAVVQFAAAGSNAAYISTTNDDGEATITIEGVPQRKNLSKNVRPYPRRAAIAVEVTIKVGNMTQDLNDAINTAMGGPVGGGLSFIADMILRTSFFFQKGRVFQVTDWKEPAWEGEFEIKVKASGSKTDKGEKGGPPTTYTWKMDRLMEGRLHTPDWEEENEQEKDYDADGRHKLEVDGDSRYFRLDDSSSAKSRTIENRYEASGPMQVQPPGPNQLEIFSRSEPSGSAELVFTGGKMILELNPFFGAKCIVGRSERGKGRSVNEAGPRYLSLLDGVSPSTFTIIEDNDGSGETIEGTKTIDAYGTLPYVDGFDATVTVKYRLSKNGPPPKNKER